MLLDIAHPNTVVPPSKQQSHHVLILDDNEGNRTLLKIAMSLGKMTFVEAQNGTQCWTAWRPGAFSCAFLDIELPDANGIEIACEMRKADPNVAIIMCSTNDDPTTINEAVAAGADMFLVKPFQLDTLITLVKVMNPENLRRAEQVLIIDNRGRVRWEGRNPILS